MTFHFVKCVTAVTKLAKFVKCVNAVTLFAGFVVSKRIRKLQRDLYDCQSEVIK